MILAICHIRYCRLQYSKYVVAVRLHAYAHRCYSANPSDTVPLMIECHLQSYSVSKRYHFWRVGIDTMIVFLCTYSPHPRYRSISNQYQCTGRTHPKWTMVGGSPTRLPPESNLISFSWGPASNLGLTFISNAALYRYCPLYWTSSPVDFGKPPAPT